MWEFLTWQVPWQDFGHGQVRLCFGPSRLCITSLLAPGPLSPLQAPCSLSMLRSLSGLLHMSLVLLVCTRRSTQSSTQLSCLVVCTALSSSLHPFAFRCTGLWLNSSSGQVFP